MKRTAIALTAVVVGMLVLAAQTALAAARIPSESLMASSPAAYDVSYPQCGVALPGGGSTAVIGVNAGRPWTSNPCLRSEFRWAAAKSRFAQLYMNTSNPERESVHWSARAGTGPKKCADLADPGDTGCAYNYGWFAARDAVARARSAIGPAATARAWWLDVETGNSWNGTTAANAADLRGSVDYLRRVHVASVGFYSTGYQWGQITAGWHPAAGAAGAPANWVAGANDGPQARSWCSPGHSFSGGTVRMVQWIAGDFDANAVC